MVVIWIGKIGVEKECFLIDVKAIFWLHCNIKKDKKANLSLSKTD